MKGKLAAAALAAASTFALASSPALANGPCGVDYDGNHACGINAPYSTSGSIVQGWPGEKDYYVFWAAPGTQINVTITAQTVVNNGVQASVEIDDSSGAVVNDDAVTGISAPYNGIIVPASMTKTLTDGGVYYLIVRGESNQDGFGNPVATPYTLSVTANSGSVQWPPPPPPSCVVPRYQGQTLATVRYRLAVNHCRAGRVYWERHSHRKRGIVLSLGRGRVGSHSGFVWWPGKQLPYGTAVDFEVSLTR